MDTKERTMTAEEQSLLTFLARTPFAKRAAIWESVKGSITPLSFADGIAHALCGVTERLTPTEEHISYAEIWLQ